MAMREFLARALPDERRFTGFGNDPVPFRCDNALAFIQVVAWLGGQQSHEPEHVEDIKIGVCLSGPQSRRKRTWTHYQEK